MCSGSYANYLGELGQVTLALWTLPSLSIKTNKRKTRQFRTELVHTHTHIMVEDILVVLFKGCRWGQQRLGDGTAGQQPSFQLESL